MNLGQHTDISSNAGDWLPKGDRYDAVIKTKTAAEIQKQKDVINYNTNIYKIDPAFESKQLAGNNIVVRLFKNDYLDMSTIDDINNVPETAIITVLPSTKIEIESTGGRLIQIDNPIDYYLKGVIVAMAPGVKEKSKETIGFELEVGQTVELSAFDFPNHKYYLDKSKIDVMIKKDDLIRGMNPYPNFEGYFIISPFQIEALIKPTT